MTPSLRGRMAWMWLGVRPIIRLASRPTASGRPSLTLTATTEGSLRTMPRPRTYTRVLAVPRSTAMSRPRNEEKRLSDTRGSLPLGVVEVGTPGYGRLGTDASPVLACAPMGDIGRIYGDGRARIVGLVADLDER